MRTARRVGTAEALLPGVTLPDLITAYRREPSGTSRDRLQAAVMRKRGKGEGRIARRLGRAQSAVSCRLRRMAAEGIAGRHGRRSPGRPCRLSGEQGKGVSRDLLGDPADCGPGRGTWTAGLLAARMLGRFGARYGRDGAPAPARGPGFSARGAGPVRRRTATAEGERRYVGGTIKAVSKYARDGYVAARRRVRARERAVARAGCAPRAGRRPRGSIFVTDLVCEVQAQFFTPKIFYEPILCLI